MEKLLKETAKIAQKGQKRAFKIGCIAKRKDGAFVHSTNGKSPHVNPKVHAEARVLNKAGRGSQLWVARVTANGELTMAKPCKKCQALIIAKGVKKVYYSISPTEYGVWYPQEEEIKNFKRTKYYNCAKWEEEETE